MRVTLREAAEARVGLLFVLERVPVCPDSSRLLRAFPERERILSPEEPRKSVLDNLFTLFGRFCL